MLQLGRPGVRLAPAEWLVALGALNVLFALFVAVQATVLFGGNDHVLRTSGLTYAEYARSGFWQLLAVAALTLVVVGLALLLASASTERLQRARLSMLGGLLVMTFVVLASAAHRLGLYEESFGLTRERLAAESIVYWLAGLLTLVLIGLVTRRPLAIVRLAVVMSGFGVLAFSLANPDGRVAQRNVAHWRETGRFDVEYAGHLSADAVPALRTLPAALGDRALAPIRLRLSQPEPWSSANLSRHTARTLLERR